MADLLVSASTGAMGSLLGKLGTMLSDEYKLLKGVRDDIEFLKAELEAMQAFLIMMAEEEKPDKQAKIRADAVREMSYEIEDNIDKFMILLEHEPSSKSDGFGKLFNKSMKEITDIKIRYKIAKDVKDIKSQVKEISERYARYKIDESSKDKKVQPRIVAVYEYVVELVGIDGPKDELLNWLSDKESKSAHQLKVISIVGYGGLGKTTLAKQVYDKLGANFECRAFVSISQNPDMTKILSSIYSQIRNKDETRARLQDPQLIISRIKNFLKDRRYFIIIDDVWDIQTWQALDCALVKNSCGNVIMTTTRKYDVAKSCCSSLGDLGFIYRIKPLCVADSKKLFFKRIFGYEEKCPPNLKEVAENILKKCGGLPLAINAISSLLATRKTKEEWDQVRSSIGFAQGKDLEIEVMNDILSLSYIDLPPYLRSCLLYLTMFPEDYVIQRQRLVHRWISEGFIHGEDGQDLVELGETYFYELVNRSLIQPVDIGCDGKAPLCRVNDTILDFLLRKSTEENFCTMLSNHSKPHSRVRRLSLMGNEDQGSVEQLDLSHARSLGAFGYSRKYLPSLVKSNVLHVLDLQSCRGLGNHHVKDIGRLFHLRYLNISWTNITELPRQIENLKYLETLDASASELVELPESITRLKQLARLFVPDSTKLPDGIGDMENLQQLGDNIYSFKQSLNFLEELGKLTNLRNLSIIWHESDEECYKEKKLSIVSSLCKLDTCKLRALSIIFDLTEKDATFTAHPFFPALNSIRQISLWGGQLSWIIKWMLSLVNLEILTIGRFGSMLEIEQQDVEMVGSIPTLLEFQLLTRCIGPIIISGGFQQLQVLVIGFGFTELMFEAGAMPNLKNLELQIELSKFKSGGRGGFDLGIQHLSSLAWIRVLIDCDDVRTADVEAVVDALKSMVDAHPNRPTLQVNIE